jgi:hypothetical protein
MLEIRLNIAAAPVLRFALMPGGDPIRVIPHRGVDHDCGSLEVWFADGRQSVFSYWDNLISRRPRPDSLTRDQAVEGYGAGEG